MLVQTDTEVRGSRASLAALWAWVARAAPGDRDRVFLMSDSSYVLKVINQS